MKTFPLGTCLGIILVILFENSCQKADKNLNPSQSNTTSSRSGARMAFIESVTKDDRIANDFEERDGILHFKNLETFLKTVKKTNVMSIEERLNFSKANNFSSLLELVQDVHKKIEEASDKAVFDNLLKDYKDIFALKDGFVTPTLDYRLAHVLNREGLVYIGKVLYCFTGEKEIIVLDGDIAKARQTKLEGKSAFSSDNIKVFSNTGVTKKGGRPAATCSNLFGEIYTSDRFGKVKSNYAVVYYITGNTPCPTPDPGCYDCPPSWACGDTYYVQDYVYTIGEQWKRNFWGNWVTYSSGQILHSRYGITVTSHVTGGVPQTFTHNNYQSQSNVYNLTVTHFLTDQDNVYEIFINSQTWYFTESNPIGHYQTGAIDNIPQECP